MISTVQLLACPDYERDSVRAAVRGALEAIAPAGLIAAGMTVLLKPNIINDMPPERAVCTHPLVVRAVAEWVLERGGEVVVADQPGYALAEEAEGAFTRTGYLEACADLPVKFELLARGGYREVAPPHPYQLKSVRYSARVLDADVVINLPKAKTHSQTLYTGAVKNMFGAMAPRQRIEVHLLGRFWALSEAIVDCYSVRLPELTLMDAVDIMEGMGPTQGKPRRLGLIAVSTDGVALDLIVQQALGFSAEEVPTTVVAGKAELGAVGDGEVVLSGPSLEEVAQQIRRAPVARLDMIGPFKGLLRGIVSARPLIKAGHCRACRACEGICPGGAIQIEDYAVIDFDRCLECFCCLEACPHDAIAVRRSPLYALARWVQKLMTR